MFICRILLVALIIVSGCNDKNNPGVSSNFESGSIGKITIQGESLIELSLKDDNNNNKLPDTWRNWWYVHLDGIQPNKTIKLVIKNRGWKNYYLPVYSYDNKNWKRFKESEVTNSADCMLNGNNCTLEINSSFNRSSVYLARYYPYTYTTLNNFLNSISDNPCIEISTIGYSSIYNKPIDLIKVSSANDEINRPVVWIHARTHPAETGASFLIEGLITQILDSCEDHFNNPLSPVYYIVPMHNPDGVIAGNYRSDLNSNNLEMSFYSNDDSLTLSNDAPAENKILNSAMINVLKSASENNQTYDILALNLHSANTDPDAPHFIFPHFGEDSNIYTDEERYLWSKQMSLLNHLNSNYPANVATAGEGGRSFLNFAFPETWWWEKFRSRVIALTLETTYGKSGFSEWTSENELRLLGKALKFAIDDYYSSGTKTFSRKHSDHIYPNLKLKREDLEN